VHKYFTGTFEIIFNEEETQRNALAKKKLFSQTLKNKQ
jgi:hypothetical protein